MFEFAKFNKSEISSDDTRVPSDSEKLTFNLVFSSDIILAISDISVLPTLKAILREISLEVVGKLMTPFVTKNKPSKPWHE